MLKTETLVFFRSSAFAQRFKGYDIFEESKFIVFYPKFVRHSLNFKKNCHKIIQKVILIQAKKDGRTK